MLATVGAASRWSLGWLDRACPTSNRLAWSTATWALSCWSKPWSVLRFMIRESGSVKLYWSPSRGPGVGGVGGGEVVRVAVPRPGRRREGRAPARGAPAPGLVLALPDLRRVGRLLGRGPF